MVSRRRTFGAALAVVMLSPVGVVSGPPRPAQAVIAQVDRIASEDPIQIAADIARQIAQGDLDRLTDLVIATGEHFSDAIVSSGLAGYLDLCPQPDASSCRRTATLLTDGDELTAVTAEVITQSNVPASRITLLGGATAVSEGVHDAVARRAGWNGEGTNPVVRVAGATRYDTAAAIATHLGELAERGLPESYRTVVVATGENPADALAASALAYRGGHLLLLSANRSVPPALETAVAALEANCVIVVGGTTALTDAVETSLESMLATTGRGACGVERIAGTDRHHTAALVAGRVADEFGSPSTVMLANGHSGALPLTAAPLTRDRTSLLSTRGGELPEPTRAWLAARPGIATLTLVGGADTVGSDAAAEAVEAVSARPMLPPPAPSSPASLALAYASTTFDTARSSQLLGPTVNGGTGPFTYAITSGSLPTGVTFDATTGAFTGPSTWDLGAVVTISAGFDHSCAVLADTTARCWGNNGVGRLGDGTTTTRLNPVTVTTGAGTPLSGITHISAGAGHTCVILADTTARCWGNNFYGQLGDGTGTNSLHPVTVTTGAGTPLSGITDIRAGNWHTCAVINDGTARCWGYNAQGRLGDGTTSDRSNPVGVLASGTQAASPVTLSGITQISVGSWHTCAVINDGTARCWGNNGKGQLGDGTTSNRSNPVGVLASGSQVASPVTLSGVTQISAGFSNSSNPPTSHTCAVINDGTARCWGTNGLSGQLGDGASGVLDKLNPVIVLAENGGAPLGGVTHISAGWEHTCVVVTSTTAQCWGWNLGGRLGNGSVGGGGRTSPVTVAAATPLSGITHISGRYLHTCVVVSVGGAHCWGDNGFGRLGDGTTVNPRLSPVAVLASGTAASSPVPLGGSLAFGPISLTVTVTDSTTATTSATVNLSSAP